MQVSGGYGKTQAIGGGCPHGSAPGACGVCGGGGGGGGVSKKSTAGLMGWNEAWATWNAIQVNKARQGDYLKAVNATNERVASQTFAAQIRAAAQALLVRAQAVFQPVMQMLGRVGAALANPARVLAEGMARLADGLQQGVQTLKEGVRDLLSRMADMAAKLTMTVLGDFMQRTREWMEKKLQDLKKLLYDEMLKKMLKAVNLEGMAEFTGKVIQRVAGWLFDKFKKPKKRQSAAYNTVPEI